MAGTGKFDDLHLSDLSLEPLPDPGVLNFQPAKSAAQKQAERIVENRNRLVTDRRVADRRKVPRFEANRRSGKERRPKTIWDDPCMKNTP
jgi:hypothetical protein